MTNIYGSSKKTFIGHKRESEEGAKVNEKTKKVMKVKIRNAGTGVGIYLAILANIRQFGRSAKVRRNAALKEQKDEESAN